MCAELCAEYAPPVKPEDFPKDVVLEGQNALKSLPTMVREAFIAERLGLLFVETGSYGYSGDSIYTSGKERYYKQSNLACFVSGTGKLYSYEKVGVGSAMGKGRMRDKNRASFGKAREAMSQVGDEVILVGSSRDVTRVVSQTAKYWLNAMPRKRREAMLAYLGGLLYKKGGIAYSSRTLTADKKYTIDFKQKYVERLVNSGAMFVDSKGEELSYNAVLTQFNNMKTVSHGHNIVIWCSCLVGVDDILSLYAADVKAMREGTEKKLNSAKPKTKPNEHTAKPAEKPEKAPNAEEQKLEAQRAGCKDLVNKLRNRPLQQRQSLFAWYLGLRYNNNGSFLASNGNQYKFWDEIWHMGGWQYMGRLTDRAGGIYPVIKEFTQEVAEMRRLYYERDAKQVSEAADVAVSALHELKPEERAAWFAAMTGLLYTADGNAGMEWSDDTSSFKVKEDARFLTAEGNELSFFDTQKAADATLWNKARDAVKMQGVLDSVLQVFDKEYKDIWKAVEAKLVPIVDKDVKFVRDTLKAMPAELCSAWLALAGELLYMPDGCGDWYRREDDRKVPIGGALFMDAEGTEMGYSKTVNEKIKDFENQWKHLLRLVDRPHMQEAIRTKYAKKLDLMRAAADKRRRELIRSFDAGY